MSSDPESAFFPSLSSLLNKSSRLISLEAAQNAFVVATKFAADNEALEKFCYDAPTFSLLASCPDILPKPTAKSKTDFEARTAPIQVSGSQNGEYDLEQMKKDALELSGQLAVEESFALRVVVLEWQSRAEAQLLSGGEDASRAAELGASVLGKSLTGFNGSVNGSAKPAVDFANDSTRRRRQLETYLKERSSRLALAADLLGYEATHEKAAQSKTWMDDLAQQLFKDRFKLETDASVADQVFDECMAALGEQLQVLDDPSKLPKLAQESDETMLMYAAATFNDIVATLRLMLVVLHVRKDIATSSMITSWFQKMESVNYFSALAPSPAWPDTTELQYLVCLISLAVLDASATIQQLQELDAQTAGGVSYPRLNANRYFDNESCVRELNLTLYRASVNNISILSPAIFAWATITGLVQEIAGGQIAVRDRMIEEGSSDNETLGRRRSSRRDSREEASLFEKLYASLQSVEMEPEAKENPPAWFGRYAEGSAFDVISQLSIIISSTSTSSHQSSPGVIARMSLLQLLRSGLSITVYGAEMLEALLAVLTPDTPGNTSSLDDINARLSSRFIEDHIFRQEILDQALTRYPFELSPVLRLMASLASAHDTVRDIIELLDRLQTMTIMVPEHFNAYTLEDEEENANEIRIEQDLPLFVSKQSLSYYGCNLYRTKALTMGDGDDSDRGTNVMCVPAGTLATVLKESRPMVFKLEHAHSGLEYLGLLLSTRLPNSEMCVAREQSQLELGTAADIIGLINALLTATLKGRKGEQDAKFVLERLSEALPVETDIVNVVRELFESELLAHLDQTAQEGSLDLLIACAELFALLVKIEPGRIWIALAHSSLLGLNGGTNALAAVVGALETALGQFRFLSACSTIFGNLISEAIGGMIKRRPTVQPAKRGRFDSPTEKSEHTPERTMQRVLNAFTGVMLEAWESLGQWRFAVPAEKSSISADICSGFALILRATYGLQDDVTTPNDKEDAKKRERRLASVLFPAADAVLDFYAPRSENKTSTLSFLAPFASAAAVLGGQSATTDRSAQIEQVKPMVELLTSLLRASREEDKEGKRAYAMATQLLKTIPDLAVIFTLERSLKATVATLLTEITTSLHSASELHDPPSLLGQLSTASAKAFLSVLSQIDRPLCDSRTEQQIWKFLCSIMEGRQQWLALYLLTGAVPKERLDRSSSNTSGNAKSLLTYALAHLSRNEDIALERSCALLEFVSAAQGASIWANNEVRNHTNFLTSIIDWLDGLQISGRGGNTREQTLRAIETKKASLVCEILAQAVHASVEVGDKGVLKMLKGKLNFLSAHGQTVDAYNRSLQLNLTDNFRSRFSGVEVEAFRRSVANPAEGYGKEWAYDLDIMDRALAHDKSWSGSMNQGGQSNGFRGEASRANVNFSLLSTQIDLLKAWSALASTLAESLTSADEAVQVDLSKSLATAVRNCLEANSTANIDVPGTDRVLMMRIEMSFVVLSKLTSSTSTIEVRAVLPTAYRALQASPADFDVATQEEDLHYYRLGLQVLFLAVQPHIQSTPRSTPTSNGGSKATDETPISYLDPAVAGVLRDIVTKVVAPAWRALAGNLHTTIACALPGDFALTTALLQAVLAVPGVGAVHTPIAEVVASTQLVRSALSLYSWSDHLAEAMDGDPVYGELAIQFLQVLSTVRPVAEHIALEGTLPQLASANLSSYFLKPGGKGPFDEPRRMFGIWAEGMLPLCLNLLDAVGPPIAGEVSGFLDGFPLQLERANIALENRDATKFQPHAGAITLGLVQEAHSLCLISMILQSDTARAAAEGIDAAGSLRGYDYKKVIEDGAGLVRQKASLASRISPASAAEAAWAGRMLDGVDSLLSAKIIKEVKGLAALRGEEEDGSGA